jgi:hypothetical protein
MVRKNVIFLILALALFPFLLGVGELRGQDDAITPVPQDQLVVKVVRVREERGLIPVTVVSAKGTTVVWYNMTSRAIRIRFDRGDQVKMACADPLHFVLQEGAFQSDEIPFGGTASLCFIELGEYAYTLTGKSGQSHPTTSSRYNHMGNVVIK